jgi:hypothetical protein
MMGFSGFSAALETLSAEVGLRAGGLGLRAAATGVAGSCLGEFWPFAPGCEFILLSDFMASLVENIRVSRLVIDGLSGVGASADFCGSESGAACPLLTRLSELGTAMPLGLTGRVSGDPTTDDCCDTAGDVWGFSAIRASLGALTEAMMMRVGR